MMINGDWGTNKNVRPMWGMAKDHMLPTVDVDLLSKEVL